MERIFQAERVYKERAYKDVGNNKAHILVFLALTRTVVWEKDRNQVESFID